MDYIRKIIFFTFFIGCIVNANEPTIEEVHKHVLQDISPILKNYKSYLALSRYKHFLPDLKFDFDKDFGKDLSISSDGGEIDLDMGSDNDFSYGFSVSWNLEGLFYNSDIVRVISSYEDMLQFKFNLQKQASKLFYERERIKKNIKLNPDKGELKIRLDEVTDNLNILANGLFRKEEK